MQGIFITGTNTDVGKTYIGTLIARALRDNKVQVIPRKPIESGCHIENGELVPADALALKEAAGYPGSLSVVCPYRFEPPISPLRAAHLANKVLTTEQLVMHCLDNSEKGFVLVEGAGGFYSPLSEDGLNADLAVALQLPVLLIAEDTIGCLNQVLLNVEAIKIRGLRLVGVVLNTLDENRDPRMDNTADLRERLDCPVFPIAFNKDGDDLPDELLERVLSQHDRRALTRIA